MRTDWRNGQFSIYFKSIHAEHSYVLTYAFLVVFSRFSITNFCTNVSNNENNCNLIIYHYLGIRNQNPFHFSFSGNVSANFGCTYKCPNFIDRHLKLTPGLIFFCACLYNVFFDTFKMMWYHLWYINWYMGSTTLQGSLHHLFRNVSWALNLISVSHKRDDQN